MNIDYKTLGLVGTVLGSLAIATAINQVLRRQRTEIGLNPAVLQTFHSRIRAWWLMCTVLGAAFLLGPISEVTTVVLFGLPRTLKYKDKKGRDLELLRSELLVLMSHVESVIETSEPTGTPMR